MTEEMVNIRDTINGVSVYGLSEGQLRELLRATGELSDMAVYICAWVIRRYSDRPVTRANFRDLVADSYLGTDIRPTLTQLNEARAYITGAD